MDYDGVALRACLNVLRARAAGGRVQRAVQLSRLTVALSLYHDGLSWLVCSAEAPAACLYVAESLPRQPVAPTPFCTCLRKHLLGSRLTDVSQEGWDRVAVLRFSGRSELGDPVSCDLVVELMGKHSNIICVRENGRIADAAKRIGRSRSRVRQVLPGHDYRPPPAQEKLAPDSATAVLLHAASTLPADGASPVPESITPGGLVRAVAGIGPARAAAVLAGLRRAPDGEPVTWEGIAASLRATAASAGCVTSAAGECARAERALAGYLEGAARSPGPELTTPLSGADDVQVGPLAGRLSAALDAEVERLRRRIRDLRSRLDSAPDPEESLRRGNELLTAVGELRRRQEEARQEGLQEVDVRLPGFAARLRTDQDPVSVAQECFETYSAGRKARDALGKLLEEAESRHGHLEELSFQLQDGPPGTVEELKDVAEDLRRAGMDLEGGTPGSGAVPRKRRAPAARPAGFSSPGGCEVLVGRNNRENDRLLRMGKPGDLWLHARGVPGAHVLLRTAGRKDVAREDVLFAAALAAGRSRAAGSSSVPVDVVPLERIRKEKGAPAGFVRYTGEETVYVSPLEPALSSDRSSAGSVESADGSTDRPPQDTKEPSG